MELTDKLKDLLNAHEMACISDFLDEEHQEDYLENTDLDLSDIKRLSKKDQGGGMDSLEDSIINNLKNKL